MAIGKILCKITSFMPNEMATDTTHMGYDNKHARSTYDASAVCVLFVEMSSIILSQQFQMA